MIIEELDDEGNVRAEHDTAYNCLGGDDTCGGCFRCFQMQYPDMRWREKKAPHSESKTPAPASTGTENRLRYTYVREKTLAEVRGGDIPRGLTADDIAIDGEGGRTFR